jgi:hypothetical protein
MDTCTCLKAAGRRGIFGSDTYNSTHQAVLVKVGAGEYREWWRDKDVLQMSATAILDELATSRIFPNDLKDVPLGQVQVWVLPCALGEEPSAADEKAAIKLRGSKPISSIMKSGDKQNVAIHVTLPTNIVSGALACTTRLVNYLRMIKYHGR